MFHRRVYSGFLHRCGVYLRKARYVGRCIVNETEPFKLLTIYKAMSLPMCAAICWFYSIWRTCRNAQPHFLHHNR